MEVWNSVERGTVGVCLDGYGSLFHISPIRECELMSVIYRFVGNCLITGCNQGRSTRSTVPQFHTPTS